MPKESLSTEDQFYNIKAKLESKGIEVIYINAESDADALYLPKEKKVFVRRGDLDEIKEEAFHVRQIEKATELGYAKPEEDMIIISAAEIEIISRDLNKLERKLKEEKDRFIEEAIKNGNRSKLARMQFSSQLEIFNEQKKLEIYREGLRLSLKQIEQEKRKDYKDLFESTLFKSGRDIFIESLDL